MPGILQEKFQVDNPQNKNDDASSGWVSDQSARTKKGRGKVPGDQNHHGPDPSTKAIMYGSLPPGMDIEDQETSDIRVMPITMGGETDVSQDWNTEAVRKGFKRKRMSPTEDEYTNAHKDAFYDEMNVEGEVGFTERNNVLDRM